MQFSSILHDFLIVRKRFLTEGERTLARHIFADGLNLDSVTVCACRWILPGYACSPNGHIYFHVRDWRDDFSQADLTQQAWLIHELTHVWQVQQGIAVFRKALFNRRYRYMLEKGKHFLQYGVEQQAQMVQDYFIRSRRGQACDDLAQCIPFLPTSDTDKSQV